MMDIEREVFDDLCTEVGLKSEHDREVLRIKVKSAVREIKNRRSYPSHFTENDMQRDMRSLYSNIHDLALYDFNQVGAEGQLSHSDNTSARSWKNREECLKGVFAWAGF